MESPVKTADFFTADDLDSALKVLEAFHSNKALRKEFGSNDKLKRLFFLMTRLCPGSKEDKKEVLNEKRRLKRDQDLALLQDTGIRKFRAQPLPISAPPLFASLAEMETEYQNETSHDVRETPHVDQKLSVARSVSEDPSESTATTYRKLYFQRSCHICGTKYYDLHFFYDQLCPSCAEFNFAKRSFSANMTGRVCIVTGARVKIGYFVALKLLRMGATVIATTRFPQDAACRYSSEPDFSSFSSRLFIHGIDFRDVKMVHHFCHYIKTNFQRLDVLINNAAQTVRKPPKFYEHLIKAESMPLSTKSLQGMSVLGVFRDGDRYASQSLTRVEDSSTSDYQVVRFQEIVSSGPLSSLQETHSSAALSQLPLLPDDQVNDSDALFPQGHLDPHLQQVDLRKQNSWTLQIGQISTLEMLECHVINAFAPWVLISELKPLMEQTISRPDSGSVPSCSSDLCDKYIVNVSAMEGQFYRVKTAYHPHTNMAKASLNMLTRTSAQAFADPSVNIFMTAVDTGWITDENPVHEWDKRQHNPPPLDEIDAAMRVLDPVLMGVNRDERMYGVFLKNYKATRW